MRYFWSMLICLFPIALLAQPNVVEWTFEVNKTNDQSYEITITGDIDKGWYVYSQYLNDDEGPIPTSVNFTEQAGYKLIDKAEESGNKIEGYDNIFMMEITKYKEKFVITQKIELTQKIDQLSGYLEFMACDEEQCLPPKQLDFTVDFQ
ncbi:MAG: protein-disulfide reductase DsbD domain-containing protein [Bacteroidota bacterium]